MGVWNRWGGWGWVLGGGSEGGEDGGWGGVGVAWRSLLGWRVGMS